ncbi:MAG: RNA polymerase sigma factor [Planctomycetota bacterium]|jgi:RNA polymerase sigma factor (sigma-70 family)
MTSSDSDPNKPEEPAPQAGAGGTEFLLREVVSGEKTQAWGMLSQKCLHYLKTRFGRSSFPQGIEFTDFVSDVMLKILTSIDSFEYRGKDSFWKWVQTLAGNMWRDLWRKHNRDQKLGLLGKGDVGASGTDSRPFSIPESTPTKEETPTQIVRFRELEKAEEDCVSRLNDQMREVYVMRRQHELSFAEISERTGGTNEATLRSHFMRARDKVRECLGAKIDALASKIQGWQ